MMKNKRFPREWWDQYKDHHYPPPPPTVETRRNQVMRKDSSPPKPAVRKPEKLLQVTTGYFCAATVWQKQHGVWCCVETAPILHWMRGMTGPQAKLALVKMQAKWQWI